MQTSTRRGIAYPNQSPARVDAPDIPLHIKDLIDYLDKDTPWLSGLDASKPASGGTLIGTWYWATDSSILYINTGTWTAIAFLASPAFSGNPTATTQPIGDSSTRLATTAFVRNLLPAGLGPLPWSGVAAPAGWLMCDGSAVSRTTYAALFAAIGTTYGPGDGTTTFNLPPTPGRTLVGKAAAGTFLNLGAIGGEETHTLTITEIAAHDHGSTSSVSAGTPTGSLSSDSAGTPSGTLNSVSAGTPAGSLSSDSAGTPSGSVAAVSAGTPSGSVHSTFIGSGGAISETHISTSTTQAQVGDANAGDALLQNTFSGNALAAHGHTFSGNGMAGHSHTFTGSALAGHAHTFTGAALTAHTHTFTGNAMAAHAHTTASAGGGLAHNNLQPYLVVNYIIKT